MNLESHLIFWVSGALAAAGLVALVIAGWSLSWPRTKGIVEVSFLDKEDARALAEESADLTIRKHNAESHAFAYRYEVAGITFLNHRRKPWGDFDWKLTSGDDADGFYQGRTFWSSSRDAAKWYRGGAAVDVYYCPFNPRWACVEPGGFFFAGLLLGAAFVVFKFAPTLVEQVV